MAVIGYGYATTDDVIHGLRLQFDYNEMFDIDFKTVLSHMEDYGEYYELRLRGRLFRIDKLTGSVKEVKQE